MLRFLLIGDFPPGQVSTSFIPTTFHPTPHIQSLVEQSWSVAKARLGDKLFDGPMCRCESFRVLDNTLHLTLSRISYKHFLGTNLTHAHLADEFGRESLANPVGISSALVSADGFLLLGRRNDSVAYYPNRVHPFAGCLEPHRTDAEPNDHTDVFAEARRELTEELSFTPSDVADIRCLGLAQDTTLRQPEVICLVRSTLSREQIERQLDATEHVAVFVVSPTPTAANEALAQTSLLTPIAAATLLLWGQTLFGPAWFTSASAPLRASEPLTSES